MHPLARTTTLLLGVLLLLVAATPAFADPAGPTNYRSVVTGVDGASEGLDAEVTGGDAFLVLRASGDREVIVPGYDEGERYLRFDPDGTVWVNQMSRTYFQNEDRYGQVAIPDEAGADAEPDWVQVASDGEYAWHDHRIHWMSPTPPEQVDTFASEPQPLYPWEVPLLIDGEPAATINGDLSWVPAPLPIVPVAVALLALAGGVVLTRRGTSGLATAALVGGVAAIAVVLAARVGLPAGVQADARLLPPAIIAVAGPLLALVMRDRPDRDRRILAGFGVLGTLVVVALQAGALVKPFIPSVLPSALSRVLLAVALGAALAGIVELIRGAMGSLPSLEAEPSDA